MAWPTWLITGSAAASVDKNPDTFVVERLEVTDLAAVRQLVERTFEQLDDNPAHAFLSILDPSGPPAVGDAARMAARIIESVDVDPARCA
jgi:hypothetical protein